MIEFFQEINQQAEELVYKILDPILSLPGILMFLATIGLMFLMLIGLIRVARKFLKAVVSVSCVFILLTILWLIFK